MQVFLTDPGAESFLVQELQRAFPRSWHEICAPELVVSDLLLPGETPPQWVFARQLLPHAGLRESASVRGWAEHVLQAIVGRLPDGQPWHLHVAPHYGEGVAGRQRCRLIRQSLKDLLQRKRRHLLKGLREQPEPFAPDHSLVQLLLLSPERGYLAVNVAPAPHQLRRVLWPFPGGDVPVAVDKTAPSRAFAKLLEAEQRMACRIAAGQECVDLGASPGSWSYVALQRGAWVTAVDRAPLRADLMSHPRLTFQRGDAFSFTPSEPVDWLLCDVIAAPLRSFDLLLRWVKQGRARRFVVTLKFKGTAEYGLLEQVKQAVPPFCEEFFLTRLSANKNEVSAFGVVRWK